MNNLSNTCISSNENKRDTPVPNFHYCFKQADWQAFDCYLCNIDWPAAFAHCVSVDDYWNCFHVILTDGIDLFVPKKRTKSSTKKRKNAKYPMFIRKLLNRKATAWRSFSRFRTAALKAKYKRLVTECKNAIKCFAVSCENNLIDSGNIGDFYKFVNSKTSVRSGVPPLRDANG